MASVLKMFDSKLFCAGDIPEGKTLTLTVAKVERGPVKSAAGEEMKPFVSFSDFPKPLALNKTNANKIIAKYGADVDGWIGKAITFKESVTTFNGQEVPCVRVQ
jgi:hypothetical protein